MNHESDEFPNGPDATERDRLAAAIYPLLPYSDIPTPYYAYLIADAVAGQPGRLPVDLMTPERLAEIRKRDHRNQALIASRESPGYKGSWNTTAIHELLLYIDELTRQLSES